MSTATSQSVPARATIVGVPGRMAGPKHSRMESIRRTEDMREAEGIQERPKADLEHARLPDPVLRTLSKALDQQSLLEERVQELERVVSCIPPPALPVHDRILPPACEADIRQVLERVVRISRSAR